MPIKRLEKCTIYVASGYMMSYNKNFTGLKKALSAWLMKVGKLSMPYLKWFKNRDNRTKTRNMLDILDPDARPISETVIPDSIANYSGPFSQNAMVLENPYKNESPRHVLSYGAPDNIIRKIISLHIAYGFGRTPIKIDFLYEKLYYSKTDIDASLEKNKKFLEERNIIIERSASN